MSTAAHEYQVVMVKLQGRSTADEEMLTDLFNERERTGWHLHTSTGIGHAKVMLVFVRDA